MEFIVLDLKNSTLDQVSAAIECNAKTASLMRSEIDKLKKAASSVQKSSYYEEHLDIEDKVPVGNKEVDDEFEDEIYYYLDGLRNSDIENVSKDISSYLPSKKHYEYRRILLRLMLECQKEIKEINEYMVEEELSLEDVKDLKYTLMTEQKRMDLIKKELLSEEKQDEKDKINKIILVPTSYGNIRILDDIDHIDLDFYDKFLGLINSIKDNTFKNAKRFRNLKELDGLCEVKDFKVRVLYTRLNEDTYAVISAFIKKSDNDLGYRTTVRSKYAKYLEIEPTIIKKLDDEEFLEENEKYIAELYRKLETGKCNSKKEKKKDK